LHLAMDLRIVDAPGMEMTGAGRYALQTATSLREARPDWHLSLYSNRPELLSATGATTIHRTRLPTDRAIGRVAWLHTTAALTVRKETPDLWFSPAFVLPLWWSGPSIVTIHDLMFLLLRGRYRGRLNAWYATAATRWSARRSDRVVCGSHATQELLVANLGIDPGKVEVIPYGVADVFFAKATSSVAKGNVASEPYILFVGTWEARKGLATLHQALVRVNSAGHRLMLVLAGQPGWGTDEILATMRRDQNVEFRERPSDDQLASLYRDAVALVYPSEMEGFGLPVAEAMASGCPVIASDLPSIREFAGEYPYYIRPGDSDGLANRIQQLLTNQPDASERREAQEAIAAFSWDTLAERTARVIEAVAHAG
jgi:glycosyltransferase involved in cell wall biosynthesis